jgi:carbonic anhydrase
MKRRKFLQWTTLGTSGLALLTGDLLLSHRSAQAAQLPYDAAQVLNPKGALQKLMAGNQRFVQGQPQYPDQTAARLHEVSQAQHPFATILSCADSRAPAELIFDQGLGDIFDVRIAGNIATPEAIGSIEYAVALLNTPLLMVMGHERCGAVTAAVQNEPLPGDISTFVNAILPAVEQVKNRKGDAVDNAVVANVAYQIQQLKRSPVLQERLRSGKLKIVGGRYDLDTGKVSLVA